MRGSDLAAQAFHIAGPDPDRRTFEGALDALGVDAEEAVMVGDQIGLDGGAIRVGIATWLLPAGVATGDQPRGLRRLLSLSRRARRRRYTRSLGARRDGFPTEFSDREAA